MTRPHPTEHEDRKTMFAALLTVAALAAACGGTTQSLTGTAPSAMSTTASASALAGTLGTFKEGNGRGHGKGDDGFVTGMPPAIGEPDAREPGEDGDEGHGRAAIQLEGSATSITGTCPDLTIVINDQTVITDIDTEFQRADCSDLAPATLTTPAPSTPTTSTTQTLTDDPTPTSFHLHIAARQDAVTGDLIAVYVRMQGPKIDGADDGADDTETPATTPTASTTPTT
jgi:hypothetical protein